MSTVRIATLSPLPHRTSRIRAVTLVEAMVAMLIMGTFLLGFLSTSLRSRRIAEASVMQAAATALTYGLVEQIKMLEYTSTPYVETDVHDFQTNDAFSVGKPPPPYDGLCVRLSQNQVTSIYCVNNVDPNVFLAPTTTPTSLTDPALNPAMRNTIGPIALSSVNGSQSQPLTLLVWAWVDNISSTTRDIVDAKCVTLIYAYQYHDGNGLKTAINREVIVRTPLKPLRKSTST